MQVKVIKRIYDFLERTNAKNVLIYGGAGGGKSFTLAQFLLLDIIAQLRNKSILISRKYNPSLRISSMKLVRMLLYEYGIPFKENKSEQIFYFPQFKSEIVFRGVDDAEKLKSTEFNYIWLEEATEFTLEDYQSLRLRLRRPTHKGRNQIFLTFNPIGKSNWIYKYFFKEKQPDTEILHVNYKDNPFLEEEYRQILKNLEKQDPRYYKIYTLGEFADLDHLVYNNWDVVEKLPESYDEIVYGLDFGYNNPTALLKIGIKDNEIYVIKELYESHLTNADLIEKMRDFVDTDSIIYADSAEPARIEELNRAGFWVKPAYKSVKDGIDFVKRHRVHIHKECVNTIEEIEMYSWKTDKEGNILEEPVKFKDHSLDALRYAMTIYFENTEIKGYKLDIL